jgi:hypothetical protein
MNSRGEGKEIDNLFGGGDDKHELFKGDEKCQ